MLTKQAVLKYDPLVNQHVLFNEVKMPTGKNTVDFKDTNNPNQLPARQGITG
jgi:hypothetical protein